MLNLSKKVSSFLLVYLPDPAHRGSDKQPEGEVTSQTAAIRLVS